MARGVLVRWGDSISVEVPITPPPTPGDLLTGPKDLIAIPRMQGAGSPRVWLLNISTAAPPDFVFPAWLLRLRAFLGVGSTVRPVVWEIPFVGSEYPVDTFQIILGASEVRITGELYLAPSSSLPSVLPALIQAWVTCAPYSPYSVSEALP